MRLYANSAAYVEYTKGEAPPNVDVLLRAASRAVDILLVGRKYDVDPTTELPTNADDAQALSDAVCAIAAEAAALDVLDPGGTQAWESVSIGSVSLSGGSKATTGVVAGMPIPPAAFLALHDVGRMRWRS